MTNNSDNRLNSPFSMTNIPDSMNNPGSMKKSPMIVILGATATGKTRLAVLLADRVNGEIISADSRQVYRGMDLGTGKDKDDYIVNGRAIRSHLIDIADAGEKYSLFQYRKDFDSAYRDIINRNKVPIVCGGSGMYLESALGLYNLQQVNEDKDFRAYAQSVSTEELIRQLRLLKKVHNTTDFTDRGRLIRALEIARAENLSSAQKSEYENHTDTGRQISGHDNLTDTSHKSTAYDNPPVTDHVFGIELSRQEIRSRITARLDMRLKVGLIEEVQRLLDQGVECEKLIYYGLEYKYITLYLTGKLNYKEMFASLNTAIHQFAKRQMTWFRRMEKRGVPIKWLSGTLDENVRDIIQDLNS